MCAFVWEVIENKLDGQCAARPELTEMPWSRTPVGFELGKEPSIPNPTSASSHYTLCFKDADFLAVSLGIRGRKVVRGGLLCSPLRCRLGSLPGVSSPQSHVPSISNAI